MSSRAVVLITHPSHASSSKLPAKLALHPSTASHAQSPTTNINFPSPIPPCSQEVSRDQLTAVTRNKRSAC